MTDENEFSNFRKHLRVARGPLPAGYRWVHLVAENFCNFAVPQEKLKGESDEDFGKRQTEFREALLADASFYVPMIDCYAAPGSAQASAAEHEFGNMAQKVQAVQRNLPPLFPNEPAPSETKAPANATATLQPAARPGRTTHEAYVMPTNASDLPRRKRPRTF